MAKPNEQIQDNIIELTYQLSQLKKNLKDCKSTNRLYNRMIVRRAVLRQELTELNNKNIVSFFKKFKPKKRENLISDYFK